jgi:ribosomal protein S18 acetylase RimI-like enzyme
LFFLQIIFLRMALLLNLNVMELIRIDATNIDQEHICCAIGNDKANKQRAQSKKDWLTERFAEGLVFQRFDARGKFFIEYMPIEKCWKPLVGKNYMVIHCLWVSGQYKGQGLSTRLLDACLAEARARHMDGVVVVSSSSVKPFLTDKRFFVKHGFTVVDTAAPYYELLALTFNAKAPLPRFVESTKQSRNLPKQGFAIVYSNQCPFMDEYVDIMANVLAGLAQPCVIRKLQSHQDVQQYGSPFGTLGVYYNGRLVSHELMPAAKFAAFVNGLLQQD